jgi:hypothetical protein
MKSLAMRVMFIPHNAYHAYNMSFIIPYLEEYGIEYIFVNIDKVYENEGAKEKIISLGLINTDYSPNILKKFSPHIVVVMNDWGGVVKKTVIKAKKKGIATVGLVEGVQDFEDTHITHIKVGQVRNPYRTVEYPLLIGEYDKNFITTDKAKVTGMPRIEPLLQVATVFPDKPLVAINSNFTYGLYTNIQVEWINSIVEACKKVGFDYIITQHHADEMDLRSYNVDKESMHDVIKRCSVFVSRFSTGILESMALGKPVIYHNPHGERMDTFQNPMEAFPITKDSNSLAEALTESIIFGKNYRKKCKDFFYYHVSINEKPSAERIAKELINIFLDRKGRN